jgi:uncharacterized membrane protein YoaK (UPF0700 family)
MWNWADHGPLPWLLLGLTIVTGLVDAFSILELGRVFVANMTGNVVFVAFALAGAPGFSLGSSLSALAGFLVGAGAGGALIHRVAGDRAKLTRAGALVEVVLVAGALALVAGNGAGLHAFQRDIVAALLATAMGVQNAVARRLAVPDLTTTVLTMTLTGIAADLRAANRRLALSRRGLAIGAMFAGAVAGAELVLHGDLTAVLAITLVLLGGVSVGSVMAAQRPGLWRTASSAHG